VVRVRRTDSERQTQTAENDANEDPQSYEAGISTYLNKNIMGKLRPFVVGDDVLRVMKSKIAGKVEVADTKDRVLLHHLPTILEIKQTLLGRPVLTHTFEACDLFFGEKIESSNKNQGHSHHGLDTKNMFSIHEGQHHQQRQL